MEIKKISTKENWKFRKQIGPLDTFSGLPKSLYLEEQEVNGFEHRVINEIANLDTILFWHRNMQS